STDSMSWSIRDIQSIVYSNKSYQGDPKSLTSLNNGNVQFTRALQYGENILIRYSFSSNGESWGQSKEAILNLTQAHILRYNLYHEGILVYEQDIEN
ncbi:MAG: hypothetical protein KGD64_15140, partial [Candidatus Heimdallarchaeota archaeon]|nr:hypothetical protein [Candidatus Heimdallarchaeota archaeon]